MSAALSVSVTLALLLGLQLQARVVEATGVGSRLSRKVGHIGLGSVLMASWTLYPAGPGARYWAAAPAAVLAGYFLLLGSGLLEDARVVRSGSRVGGAVEFATGPSLYAMAFAVLTIVFWASPLSAAPLAFLVFGDSSAEIVGRGLSTPHVPWSRNKTWGGLLGAFVGGLLGMGGVLVALSAAGFLDAGSWTWLGVAGIAGVGAVVESTSGGSVDNLALPVACAGAAWLLL